MTQSQKTVNAVRDALDTSILTYNELNAARIDELTEEPSALDFMQYCAHNRPFVIRQGARSWKAVQRWNYDYLVDALQDTSVNVAITPHGNADAILEKEDGSLSFVKPYEREEAFEDFVRYVIQQEQSVESSPTEPVKYGQTQNDNLRDEYQELFNDVPPTVPFARIALRKAPEAVNFWLGNRFSVTSLHKDNYENIYAQIVGQKHFVLLPPIDAPCVAERNLPAETYVLNQVTSSASPGSLSSLQKHELVATPDSPPSTTPVATWDPDHPSVRATPYSMRAQQIRVTLNEGDMLYLPAMWYHKVSQSCGSEGFSCAVNYWYDMDFGGGFWATNAFVRDVAIALEDA
ncbi:hypothetical protein FH972_025790 [Carpinus fangiana]|uniref:JmjC domain-containing protein n=1 Tax=Carpinus fangiana TaxID=176857 RepID=A0A5N6L2G1_9ROSI|nr:hypothetical protein FH972_025790 [Carpinus fangiana]